MRRDTQGAS
ncbi:hypothetical protein E2C01_050485 [Portunus trituberculatus]|uniref:Uncharacterized protein n=1 Tax=Portunus trituberculatus TaxID=210409 RepID=A0A5B7GGM3_PORTR|nr:hypothetical protein [Portunus trituberculatus]